MRAIGFENPGLDPDELIDREIEINKRAAALVAKGTHTPEEAETEIREHFSKVDEGMAEWSRRRAEQDAAYLGRFGAALTANLHEYTGSSLKPTDQAEKTKPSLRERLSRGKLGKWVLGSAVAATVVGGGAEVAHQVSEANQAEFEATQAEISPVIKDAMIDIDNQTLNEQRLHPDTIRTYANPDGHMGVTEFRSMAGNVKVIMGNTDGKPDPSKPLYIDYLNNVGREGKIGTPITMTSPEGNQLVDEADTEFGGSTDGGWAARTVYADTTYRGYDDSLPAPLEAAQKVVKTAQEQKPYDPYR